MTDDRDFNLERINRDNHDRSGTFPYLRTKEKKKSETNSLKDFIENHAKENGYHCASVQTKGTSIKGKEVTIDKGKFSQLTLSKKGGINFIPSGGTLGASDFSILMRSKIGTLIAWECESKIKYDTQSHNQKKYQRSVEKMGIANSPKGCAFYTICKSKDDYLKQYNNFYNNY